MYKIAVGESYVPGMTSLAPITNYNFRGGQHELTLIFDRLTAKEIQAVRSGASDFGVFVYRRVIFFLYRFAGLGKWSDAPYSIWRVPAGERSALEHIMSAETRAVLHVVLVDADKNKIEVIRAVSISPPVTRALHSAINDQLRAPISNAEYDSAISEAFAKWPHSEEMARIATVGGGGQ